MKVDLFEAEHGDDLDWQVIAEPGDTISWKKARSLDEVPLPRDQTIMVKPGTFISAMWLDEKDVERFEFAYVVAIREIDHSDDPGEPVLLVVSWLKTIRSTKEGIKPWMKKLDLDRSSMILSTDFDIIELECVADIVTDEIDANGTVFTYPLAESEQVDGLAIALNCRRWYGRLNYFRSRIHNGTVRVDIMPKEALVSPSPARKRKAKENLAEPTDSPKKSRVSPNADEPTETGSPKKPAPRGRTMVLDNTTVTRRRKSPVAAKQSSKAPAMARRSKVSLKPATTEEEENSETLANAPDDAARLAALTLEPVPATKEKKTPDRDAIELDSPKTFSETDAELTRKKQIRAQSAEASKKLSEVARATRASSAVPKSGLKVTFIGVDKQTTDGGPLAPLIENEEANLTTLSSENDVFMGYNTTNGVTDDDAFGISKLLPGIEEHATEQSGAVIDNDSVTLLKQARIALSFSEVATPEKAAYDTGKHDIRTMLQDPTSPDELSRDPTPKIKKLAPAEPVIDGETIKVTPKPGTIAVAKSNTGKKVTAKSTKPDSEPHWKEDAVIPKKDTAKKDTVVNQAEVKKSKTKTTSAPKKTTGGATTFIDDQAGVTKPIKNPATPKKAPGKTATAVDSPVDDQALVKKVTASKKSATKTLATNDKPAEEKAPANPSAQAKKAPSKGETAEATETAAKADKNEATVLKKILKKIDTKKQTSTAKTAGEKTTAKKTAAPKKDTAKPSAASASAKATKPKPATKKSPKAQETAEKTDEEEQAKSDDEEVDDKAIAEMERQLAAMKAKRKSKA